MGIFSGVQFISILCSIVRTKLVALWIGAVGIGIFGLYNSAIDMITTLSQLGLRNSAIPKIAGADSPSAFARICYVVRRWNWALGILGAMLTLLLSPLLSRLTFGDSEHTLGFIALSVSFFFASITSSESSILQGAGSLARMARASIVGTVASLICCIPLYYFFGVDSIVPSMIVYSAVTAGALVLMRQKVANPKPALKAREVFREGADFVKLGFYMTASSFVALAAYYVTVTWLNWRTGTETVGLYQAGYTLANRYIGLVFFAIVMEYYPRLSRVSSSRIRLSVFVGHESLIALTVILPVATLFMAFDDIVIRILYSGDFEAVAGFLSWALAGTALRAFSWCMAFVILAKGDGRTYIITESTSALASIGLNIAGYTLGGLSGMGIAYVGWYLLYTIIVAVVYFRVYRLRLSRIVAWTFVAVNVITVVCASLRSLDLRLPVIIVGCATAIATLIFLRRLLHKTS